MNDIIIEVEGTVDADGHVSAPVALDLGPVVEAGLSTSGLVGQPSDSSEGPSDFLPPPGEASQAELAATLSAAERTRPKGKKNKGKAEPAQPDAEPFLVGRFRGKTPIYGCPSCAIRAQRPEDIMWHLRSYPAHAR